MNDTLFSINGKIVPEKDAVVPVTDRGFLYGDGVFETIHAYGNVLFRSDEHLRRIKNAGEILYFDHFPKTAVLAEWLAQAVKHAAFAEANVRMTITRGQGPRGPSIKGPFAPNVIITVTDFPRPPANRTLQGVYAITATFRRQESAATARLKTLNYIEQILARREADLAGADEALMLNNAGLLCEGSASNISLIKQGALTLPDPERAGALPGIAQITAIEAAHNLRIPVMMTSLSPWDPGLSEEAFLTGSMREITPLVKLDEKIIGSGKPGPVTLRIIEEYRRIVERTCRPFKFPSLKPAE